MQADAADAVVLVENVEFKFDMIRELSDAAFSSYQALQQWMTMRFFQEFRGLPPGKQPRVFAVYDFCEDAAASPQYLHRVTRHAGSAAATPRDDLMRALHRRASVSCLMGRQSSSHHIFRIMTRAEALDAAMSACMRAFRWLAAAVRRTPPPPRTCSAAAPNGKPGACTCKGSCVTASCPCAAAHVFCSRKCTHSQSLDRCRNAPVFYWNFFDRIIADEYLLVHDEAASKV